MNNVACNEIVLNFQIDLLVLSAVRMIHIKTNIKHNFRKLTISYILKRRAYGTLRLFFLWYFLNFFL